MTEITIESNVIELSRQVMKDGEDSLILDLGFDSNGMKRKRFDSNDKKEKKLCYLNEYCVYETHPIDNHPCYEVLQELGRGAFGQVLKVKMKAGEYKNNIYAIKRCDLGVKKWESLKMLREVIANMKLRGRMLISCWLDWIEYDQENNGNLILNLCMELADGSLRNWMKCNKDRKYMSVICMITDICEAIEFIHSKGIIYLNLKPENILLFNGKCVLGDFGTSVLARIDLQTNSEQDLKTWIGVYSYMAPEVMTKKEYTNKVDIFSLGLICMQLMVGFDDEQESMKAVKNLKENSLLPEIFRSNLIEEGKLIVAMTDHDPQNRPHIIEINSTFWLISRCRDSVMERRLTVAMRDDHPQNRPESGPDIIVINSPFRDFISGCRDSIRHCCRSRQIQFDDEENNDEDDFDEERLISDEIAQYKSLNQDTGINYISLSFKAFVLENCNNFDKRLDFEEELLGEGTFNEVKVTLRKYKDGTNLVIKTIELNKFDEIKANKLLFEITEVARVTMNKSPELKNMLNILFFEADFDLNELTLFTQTDYCQYSLVNWMKNNEDRFDRNKHEISIGQTFQFFSQILNGLTHLKLINFVHRDLKPSNIFLAFDSNWKISDCGLSLLRLMEYECEQDYYQSLIKKGVPVYAAPEQVNLPNNSIKIYQEHSLQFKIDVYSIGLIMCEYLTPTLSKHNLLFEALENVRNKNLLPDSMEQTLFEQKFYEIIFGMVRKNSHERLDEREVCKKLLMLEVFKRN